MKNLTQDPSITRIRNWKFYGLNNIAIKCLCGKGDEFKFILSRQSVAQRTRKCLYCGREFRWNIVVTMKDYSSEFKEKLLEEEVFCKEGLKNHDKKNNKFENLELL